MEEHRELFAKCIRESCGDVAVLQQSFIEVVSVAENDKKSIFEQSFRDEMHGLIQQLEDNEDVAQLKDLVLLSVRASENGVCYHTVPFLLLADALDCVTLDVCEQMFDLIESHVTIWTQPSFFSSGKILLLRMCNELLRRLSSAQNTVFCGRIQLFLSRLFPLSEKSALNLMSHFNLENVTTYNKLDIDNDKLSEVEQKESEEAMDVDKEDGEHGPPIDFNLYKKLWSLQDIFRQPTQCFTTDQWKLFSSNTMEVIQAFTSYKLEDLSAKKRKGNEKLQSKKFPDSSTSSHYFAKYLTSEKVMALQLSDSHFRRHILLQLLILFQYLQGDVKFKGSSQVLTESQSSWVVDMTAKVYGLLEETPSDGKRFAEYIRHALKREETWMHWKNDGCPSYERNPASQLDLVKPTHRCLGDLLKNNKDEKDLGSDELSRLWNLCPDNFEACQTVERMFIPSVDVFLEDAVEQAEKKQIPSSEKVINNPNYCWQSLRLLSQSSPHFFHPAQAQIKPLSEFLESVIVQTAKTLEQ